MKYKFPPKQTASDVYVLNVKDGMKYGEVSAELLVYTEGYSVKTGRKFDVSLDLWQIAKLAEEARKVADAQIVRLQQQRNQLGRVL